ncbi:MAG TPA: TfoX/Sxy family protein [Flavisolibacter sp.]|jgi:TfoX/Sxy family transcriptional regulator of competence genes|nr:TfoX/Sxy family protein [Flavisolibacter sp.]
MAYDIQLANSVREYLVPFPALHIEEKKMFRGLAFLINDKLCVCVSGNNLMCRFDPALHESLAEKAGVEPMIMKGKILQAYCYVTAAALQSKKSLPIGLICALHSTDGQKHPKRSSRKAKPNTVAKASFYIATAMLSYFRNS